MLDANWQKFDYKGPVFLYDTSRIQQQIAKLKTAFAGQRVRLLYAIKANDYLPVVEYMVSQGLGLHISSKGEYERVKHLSSYVSHTGPFIDSALLADKTVHFNVNSLEELALFGPHEPVGLRVNPECGWSLFEQHAAGSAQSQFGVPYSQLENTMLPTQICRLHMHSNSDSLEIEPYIQGFDKLLRLAAQNPHIGSINIGGGFGVPLPHNKRVFDVGGLASELGRRIESFAVRTSRHLELQIECGSYYVREAGRYVCQIKNVVHRKGWYFYYTDGSTIHLQGIRVNKVVEPFIKQAGPTYKSSVIGATCMRGDELAWNIALPKLAIGDLVIVQNAGAYCAVQATRFNRISSPFETISSV